MDVNTILQLVDEGLTHKQIAERLGTTVGKLSYQLTKHRRTGFPKPAEEREPRIEPFDDDAAWERYGTETNRLLLLPRDPGCLYAYWTIADDRKRMTEEYFHCGWQELPKYLRIYDVSYLDFNGDNANKQWMIAINQEANNWFIQGLSPDCTYIADYGTTRLDGTFVALLRSGAVRLPPSEEGVWQPAGSAVVDVDMRLSYNE